MGKIEETHTWVAAFLANRTQRVVVNCEFSTEASVSSGVPQWSVLGPLLFLCYINVLRDCVKSQVRLSADDSLLYRPIRNMNDIILLQQDLLALEKWAEKWMMYFNPTNSYVMRFARSRSPLITACTLCNYVLEEHHTNPYFAVLLSDDAKCSSHIYAVKPTLHLDFVAATYSTVPGN